MLNCLWISAASGLETAGADGATRQAIVFAVVGMLLLAAMCVRVWSGLTVFNMPVLGFLVVLFVFDSYLVVTTVQG